MALTEEDVNWCYLSILGRSPESVEVVKRHVSLGTDFRSLVLSFLDSQEYRDKKPPVALVPLDRREMDVEARASAADLSAMKDRIREAWTHLGLVRAHYSVLNGSEFLPESINTESIERLYASGVTEVSWNDSILRRYGFSHPESKTCVEYGCGVGRVTLPLAKMFRQVHAYDISANHLALAERRAAALGIHNVEFHLCSADLVIDNLEECDFFYSRIVFQHNPPPIIRELIVASLQSLREGGVAIFQVPTYMQGYSFWIKEYLATPRTLDMEMHCIPQHEVLSLITDGHCKILEVREDGSIGHIGEWISNTFVVQRLAGPPRL